MARSAALPGASTPPCDRQYLGLAAGQRMDGGFEADIAAIADIAGQQHRAVPGRAEHQTDARPRRCRLALMKATGLLQQLRHLALVGVGDGE